MPVKCATPYYSVVLDATVGLAQALNPSIRSTLSKNGHVLTLYNISESDISQIRIPSPDGKSNQNIHFEGLAVYSATQSPLDIIRVYGLSGIVGQTYRQEAGSAYTKLSEEATFQPWLNLNISSLADQLSAIGNNAGVSQSTIGIQKLFSVILGNSAGTTAANIINSAPEAIGGVVFGGAALYFAAQHLGLVPSNIPDYGKEDMPRVGIEAEAKDAEEAEEEAISQEAATQAATQAETLAAQEAAEEAETEAAADETAAGTEEAEEEEDLEADLDEDLV